MTGNDRFVGPVLQAVSPNMTMSQIPCRMASTSLSAAPASTSQNLPRFWPVHSCRPPAACGPQPHTLPAAWPRHPSSAIRARPSPAACCGVSDQRFPVAPGVDQQTRVARLPEPGGLIKGRSAVQPGGGQVGTGGDQQLHDSAVSVAPGHIGQGPVFFWVSRSSQVRLFGQYPVRLVDAAAGSGDGQSVGVVQCRGGAPFGQQGHHFGKTALATWA